MITPVVNRLRDVISPGQLWLTVVAWVLLPLAWLALRQRDLPSLLGKIAQRRARATATRTPTDGLQAWGRAINRAGRLSMAPHTCLSRSLVCAWLLAGRGVDHSLRIGVRTENGQLHAHAWVEVNGMPINDRADIAQGFAVFDGPLAPSHWTFP